MVNGQMNFTSPTLLQVRYTKGAQQVIGTPTTVQHYVAEEAPYYALKC